MESLRNLPEEDDPVALRKALLRSRRDQADLRCLIENTNDAIWSMDLDFNLLVFNSAASLLAMNVSGKPMEAGRNFLQMVSAKERNRWETAGRRVRGHEHFSQIHVLEWKTRVHRFDVSFSPIFDEAVLAGIAVFCREIQAAPETPSITVRDMRGFIGSNLPARHPEKDRMKSLGNLDVTEAISPPPAEIAAAAGAAPGLRILVCEDNPINQLVIVKMAESMECAVDLASNGREALQACRAREYDLIFMDYQMPEMDGCTTASRLRLMERRGRKRPWIVAMTADVVKATREKCLAAGMDGYLAKPILLDALKAVLAKAGWRPPGAGLPTEIKAEQALLERHGVDLRMVNRLRAIPGNEVPGKFPELLRLYLTQASGEIEEMEKLIVKGRTADLAASAHALKGLSLNFGALAVARACETLQCTAEAENRIGSADALSKLRLAQDAAVTVFSALAKRQWELSPP